MLNRGILKIGLISLAVLSFGLMQAEGLPGDGIGGFNPPTFSVTVECWHNEELLRTWTGVDIGANPNPCAQSTPSGMVLNWDNHEELSAFLLHNSNLGNLGHKHLDPEDEDCNFFQEVN